MKLGVLTSSYKIRGYNNNKLIEKTVNKSTILWGFIGVKIEVFDSMREYLGGDG
jgi:ribosomal protein S19